jgi:hypothetical protein
MSRCVDHRIRRDARTFVTFRDLAPGGFLIVTRASFAWSGLPAAILAAVYDAANQQLTLFSVAQTFGANGNLLTHTNAMCTA